MNKKVCIECGKEEQYAKQMCQQCYQADYRAKHPKKKLEGLTEKEWREELRKPNDRCDTKRQCHFCPRIIPPRFAWCIVCASKMPITICPKCGKACYLDEKLACTECGASLVGMEKRENGLIGISHKLWPEWLSFLKADSDREYRDDLREASKGVDLYSEEGVLNKGVAEMDYKEFVSGTNRNQLNISDLSLDQVLQKYVGLSKEEHEILTAPNLKVYAKAVGIKYWDAKRARKTLEQKWVWRLIAMMLPADTPTVLEFKHDLSGCR